MPPCEFECDVKSFLRGQGAIKLVIGAFGILKRGVDRKNSFHLAKLTQKAGLTQGLVGRRRWSLAHFGRRLRPGTPRRRHHIVNGLAKSARRRVVDSSCARLLALVLRGTAERRRPAAQLRETIGRAIRAHFIFGGARAESCIVSNPASGGIVSPS